MDQIGTLALRCPCGGKEFRYPDGLNINDESARDATVSCTACGLESKVPS